MQLNHTENRQSNASQGFSLIELVIVIVIIGVIGAIAIPRMTQGANNAGSAALKGDLQVLRQAVELYRAEHEGRFPSNAAAGEFASKMISKTKLDGTVDATGDYGPYLAEIPDIPVGPNEGANTVAADPATPGEAAWIYDPSASRTITANTGSATNQDSVKYSTY